ncbi:MAG: hypothetical protein QHH07_09025 [Sedimentisphaerales bacterium]|jgi:hypothetical protein|nr:hypothetical protein [Sedimentisphaerales bacterium]
MPYNDSADASLSGIDVVAIVAVGFIVASRQINLVRAFYGKGQYWPFVMVFDKFISPCNYKDS